MTSKIPAVLDALVSALQAAPELSGVAVDDGPVVSDGSTPEYISVGYDGDPEGAFEAATSEEAYNDLYGTRGEQIAVPCAIVVARGSTEALREARTRAFELHGVLTDMFAATPGIAGPQTQAALGSTRLHQTPTDSGIEVRLALAVVCESLG